MNPDELNGRLQQAQIQAQMQAQQNAQVQAFMFDTIGKVYAALVAQHGQDTPLSQLCQDAQTAAEYLGIHLGILKPKPAKPEVNNDENGQPPPNPS